MNRNIFADIDEVKNSSPAKNNYPKAKGKNKINK